MSVPAIGALLLLAGAPLDPGASATPNMTSPVLAKPVPDVQPFVPPTLLTDPATPPRPDATTLAAPDSAIGPDAQVQLPSDETEIIVTSRTRRVPGDPLREFNFAAFQATIAIDGAVIRPAALAYSRIVPEPIRLGIRNFLDNVRQPVVFVNFVLQHKIGKAVETLVRFGINTTLGVLGLFDFAKRKPFRLPDRRNGFANTLGFYGVKTGPFLFLPIVGPTTARDLVGLVVDRLLLPIATRKLSRPVVTIPLSAFGTLDQRDQFDERMEALKGDKSGFYTATREDYLKERQAEIDALRGKRLPPLPSEATPQR